MVLKSIAGIDLDGQAIKRGLKRIQTKHADTLASVQTLMHFAAYEADMCCQAASLPGMGDIFHSLSHMVSCTSDISAEMSLCKRQLS